MKSKILVVLLVLLMPACSSNNNQHAQKRTYLFQLRSDSPALVTLKEEIAPVINTIIKDELALEKNYDFNFFIPKDTNALTIYYVNDAHENGKIFIESALDKIEKFVPELMLHTITIKPAVSFFGEPNEWLVIMMDDPSSELSKLNQEMKKLMHEENEKYKNDKHVDLYDTAKSELYPFLPHIGLGRIRTQSITQHIKDPANAEKTFDRITGRILEAVTKTVEERLPGGNQLFFNRLCILDLAKRDCIKTIELEKT